MDACVFDGPPFAGASDAALYFVDYQQDAVAITDASQFLHENRRRDYVSAFALHRLDEDCGYFLGGKRGFEQLVLDEAGAAEREGFGILRAAFASAVYVRVANVGHAWNHGTEAALLLRLGSGQRECAHGASVKCSVERDHVLPLGVIARKFEGALDGFSAGVAVVNFVRAGHGRDLRQALGQRHHVLVIEIGAGHVNQFRGLLLNGGDHIRVAMSGRGHGDSSGEIKKFIAINVGDHDAASLLSNQWIRASVRRRNIFAVARENALRVWTRQRGDDLGRCDSLSWHGILQMVVGRSSLVVGFEADFSLKPESDERGWES